LRIAGAALGVPEGKSVGVNVVMGEYEGFLVIRCLLGKTDGCRVGETDGCRVGLSVTGDLEGAEDVG
jgi:hypothetical protein